MNYKLVPSSGKDDHVTLSIVTTLYKSSPFIEEFYERICISADKITPYYEIIMVNDGSPDNTMDIALSLFEKDYRVKIIDLSRNFGHHKAIMTGLSHAKNDLVFLIDCDLEESPDLLELFYKQYQLSDVDVVFGVQKKRKGGIWERVTGNIFYTVFNWLSDISITENLLTVRLMSKKYVTELIKHKDQNVFLAGLMQLTGYSQKPVIITKRDNNRSSYTTRIKIDLLINAITSFSSKPLIMIFNAGCVLTLISVFSGIYFAFKKIFVGIDVSGWTSMIVLINFFSGIIILFLGIIGIYLAKIFNETKDRPYTTVRNLFSHETFEEKATIPPNSSTEYYKS